MNRYLKHGIAADVVAGKNVVLIARTYSQARAAMTDVLHQIPERKVANVRWANGAESFETKKGGRLRILAASKTSPRGYSADIVVALGYKDIPTETIDAFLPTLAATKGELIRA